MSKKLSPAESAFEDVVEIGSLIPWWITVIIIIALLYLVPSPFYLAAPTELESIALYFLKIFFATVFKYIVPFGLFLGLCINLYRMGFSAFLFKEIERKGARETIKNLSWHDFEILISEYFKKQGYQTEILGGNGADGGVDVRLFMDGKTYLVQCKHYKSWRVSVKVVRELLGVVAAENAQGGFVITSGKFTKGAVQFAESSPIKLIDGIKLEEILDAVQTKEESLTSAKICPKCGSVLVERSGKRGKFLGCSTFPECRYTESI